MNLTFSRRPLIIKSDPHKSSSLNPCAGEPITPQSMFHIRPITKPARLAPSVPTMVVLAMSLCLSRGVMAQAVSPVYVNDSPAATESLSRVDDLIHAGNLPEAASVLQVHLDADSNRLVPQADSDIIYTSVRTAINRKLLATPDLLRAYRETFSRKATKLLETGRDSAVESTYLLTPAGFEATLRVAQRSIEKARFHAARLYLLQLDSHPDRTGPAARDAAEMATLLLTYLDNPEFRALAQRWRHDAGMEEEIPTLLVLPRFEVGRSPLDPFSSVDMSSLVSTPLRSSRLSLNVLDSDTPATGQSQEQVTRQREWASRGQFVMPSLMGETLYVNDGLVLRALERFTLAPIWEQPLTSFRPADMRAQIGRRQNQNIEDLCLVAVNQEHAIVAEGIATEGTRLPVATIASFDPSTGVLQWRIDPTTTHSLLQDASVRGPVQLFEDTLVVSFVKQVRQRRLLSVLIAGFDPDSGHLRWVEPLCSSGSLPYGQQYLPAQKFLVRDGMAYHVDRLGAISAVEIETGRIHWIRLEPSDSPVASVRDPWKLSSPIMFEDTLYTLAPDEAQLLALDAQTGELLWRRASASFGNPRYLELMGSTLLAVGDASVSSMSLRATDPVKEPVDVLIPPQREIFVGRLARGNDSIVIPQSSGLLLVTLDAKKELSTVPLAHAGNVLITKSQIIVTDEQQMHSYLLWDVAENLLLTRMQEDPDNPRPASTYARLAYADGRADRILQAVDHALRAIELDPLDPTNKSVRRVLFDAVLEMVVEAPFSDLDDIPSRTTVLSHTIRTDLFERLDRLASTSEQRVTALFARGKFHETTGDLGQAIALYQQILGSRDLGAAQFAQGDVTHTAWRTATERVRRLVAQYGQELYARFDAQASAEYARGFGSFETPRIEHFARQYPLSGAAAQAWGLLAQRAIAANKPRSAISALEQAVKVSLDTHTTSQPWFPAIASELVSLLEAHGRTAAAIEHLQTLGRAEPGLMLDSEPGLVGVGLRITQLNQKLVIASRPRIGLVPERPSIYAVEGWVVEEPLIAIDPEAASRSSLLGTAREMALWDVDPNGGLLRRWTIARETTDFLVWFSDSAVLISHFTDLGRTLELLDARQGKTLWTSQPPRDPQQAQAPRPGDALHVEMPMGSPRSIHETIITSTPRVAVLAERSGLCWAIDLQTGTILWNSNVMENIFDVAIVEDMVAVGGQMRRGNSLHPGVATFSLDNGELIHEFEPQGGQIVWLRVSSERDLVIGTEEAITAWDPMNDSQKWSTSGAAGFATVDAWSFPGRLIVLSNIGKLFQIDAETGRAVMGSLDARSRFQGISEAPRPIRTALIGDLAAFSTNRGTAIFDHRGELFGAELRHDDRDQVPAVFGQNRFVGISQQPVNNTNRRQWFRLTIHDGPSAMLLQEREISLVAQPSGIHLLNDRILIEVGGTTIVIDTEPTSR